MRRPAKKCCASSFRFHRSIMPSSNSGGIEVFGDRWFDGGGVL
jgi:hypothetical protein